MAARNAVKTRLEAGEDDDDDKEEDEDDEEDEEELDPRFRLRFHQWDMAPESSRVSQIFFTLTLTLTLT